MKYEQAKMHIRTFIAVNADGTYDAFVGGKGFAANVSLEHAKEFIRREGGADKGTVPVYIRGEGWGDDINVEAKYEPGDDVLPPPGDPRQPIT